MGFGGFRVSIPCPYIYIYIYIYIYVYIHIYKTSRHIVKDLHIYLYTFECLFFGSAAAFIPILIRPASPACTPVLLAAPGIPGDRQRRSAADGREHVRMYKIISYHIISYYVYHIYVSAAAFIRFVIRPASPACTPVLLGAPGIPGDGQRRSTADGCAHVRM